MFSGAAGLFLNSGSTLIADGYVEGCNLFEVPYDWRLDLDIVVEQYLKPWIARAKQMSNQNKVNVIAHSMGGLLTRTYIQGLAHDVDVDIKKFAMVGTPNMGSANAYYLWEGGDPLLADNIISSGIVNFYWNTTEENYELSGGKIKPSEHDNIWRFYTGGAPEGDEESGIIGLKQLLPTYGFLGHAERGELQKVTNDFLQNLNDDSNRFRMGTDFGQVETIVFYSESEETIETVNVGLAPANSYLYRNGFPLDKEGSAFRPEESGDGTVLKVSALLPYNDPQGRWAEEYEVTGKHSALIKTSAVHLVDFLNGELDYSQPVMSAKADGVRGSEETEAETYLTLSIKGRAQPYLVNPAGLGCGINPLSSLRENEIPGVRVSVKPDSSLIELENIESGVFTLQLKNVYAEDYTLSLGFADSETSIYRDYHGFIDGDTITFSFTIDLTAEDKFIFSPEPALVTGLQAQAVMSNELITRLEWEASGNSNVKEYDIYFKESGHPYLTWLATTANTFFDTAHPWAADATILTRLYAVSAVDNNGRESFLSEMVTNDDRDHDGLADLQETVLHTAIDNADSDSDGLLDGEEINRGTNPLNPDTDSDGCSDFYEGFFGSDPLDIDSRPVNATDFEPDGDVDGYDLAFFIHQLDAGSSCVDLEEFADFFGR